MLVALAVVGCTWFLGLVVVTYPVCETRQSTVSFEITTHTTPPHWKKKYYPFNLNIDSRSLKPHQTHVSKKIRENYSGALNQPGSSCYFRLHTVQSNWPGDLHAIHTLGYHKTKPLQKSAPTNICTNLPSTSAGKKGHPFRIVGEIEIQCHLFFLALIALWRPTVRRLTQTHPRAFEFSADETFTQMRVVIWNTWKR